MHVHHSYIVPTSRMLHHLDVWLGKAQAFAEAKKFDINVLMHARLAPDQFPLSRQIQSACDAAKLGAARLSGKTAPVHPDTEQTVEELRARIAEVIAWLGTMTPEDFEGATSRTIHLSFAQGRVIDGDDYLVEMALPNFYFHACMAYAILRHNGVELGKRDYLGQMSFREA